jgi:hypothetical protein
MPCVLLNRPVMASWEEAHQQPYLSAIVENTYHEFGTLNS